MRRSYRDSIERRVRSASLTEPDFLRAVRMVHRIESGVRAERRCIYFDIDCGIKTACSWCHLHREEEDVQESLARLRARIEAIALDRPALGSAAFVRQVALEERERMALEDAKELDIHIEQTDGRDRQPHRPAVAA